MSIRAVTAFVFATVSFASYAADFPPPKQSEWTARNFKFHTGEVMPELRIHYTTIGKPDGIPVTAPLRRLMIGTKQRDMALFVLAGLLALVLTRSQAVFLTLGISLGILLGAALAAGFALRYLVPVVAELAVLGTLSAELLASAARGWRDRRASPLAVREADRS